MKQSKKTFLMYKDWIPLMKTLPREKLGDLMYAVACYQAGEDVQIDDPIVSSIFEMFRVKFDENEAAYQEQCEKNARIARERTVTKRNEPSRTLTDMDKDMDKDRDKDRDKGLDKESLTGQKASCSEQSTEPTPDCDGLILNDGSEWWPTVERYKEYERCYPGVNVQREFAKMRSWCIDNPKKRKTRNGIARFVNSWLSKEQDSGTRASPYMQSIQNRVANVDDWSAALKEKLHDSG